MLMQVEEAIEVYREYSKFPTVNSGRICTAETPGHLRVYSQWSQRDLERNENIKFSRTHIIQLDVVFPTPPHEIGTEQLRKESPSGKFTAIVRKVKDKKGEEQQYIEVWNENKKLNNIEVQNLEQHGKVYEDATFGCLQWSHSETHLLYVAEKKRPKSKSFFDKKAAEELEQGKTDVSRGDEHEFTEYWGEQFGGKSHPVLCVLDVEAGMVSILDNLPAGYSAGPAVWCPNDSGVVCVGTCHEPYRLGIKYCPIRKSILFHIDLKSFECTPLSPDDRSSHTPVFSPDNSKIVYIDNNIGGPHMQCQRLVMCDWGTKGIVPVVEVVRQPDGDNDFPGIYCSNGLNYRCWASDSKRIILETMWQSKYELIAIHVETGEVIRLSKDESVGGWHLLDVHNDLVLAVCSSPNQPQYLVLGHLPAAGSEASITWTKLDEPELLQEISWRTVKFDIPKERINEQYNVKSYEGYLMEPTLKASDKKPPLIVYIHGGPHSNLPLDFMLYMAALCRCGHVIFTANYRGSIGFGQDSIDSLPGNVGVQDVQDVQGAVEKVLEMGVADPDRVVVIGGSHGGFLTAHLVGQYPDFYKAACVRNPALNIASMVDSKDNEELCYTECGLKFEYKRKSTPEMYETMCKMSPMQYVDQMKTPMMIMIGSNDLRVPPRQGHELRKALQARGVPVRTLCYADNSHPINKVDAEADAFVNIVQWFYQHVQ